MMNEKELESRLAVLGIMGAALATAEPRHRTNLGQPAPTRKQVRAKRQRNKRNALAKASRKRNRR